MSEHIEKLIIKSLQGNILPEEHYELEYWIAEDEQNQQAYNEFVVVWKRSAEGSQPPAIDANAEWNRLRTITEVPQVNEGRSRVLTYVLRAAAVISFVFVSTYIIQTTINKDRFINFTSTTDTLSIKLPDGSRVTLNRDTELSYHEDFKNNRSINLKGEAFFEVEKDKAHPFVVRTSSALVKVVGTSFNVDGRLPGVTKLSVLTGAVMYAATGKESNALRFVAGESAVAYSAGKIDKTNELNATSWKDRKLRFDATPMSEVIETITEYFGREILIPEQLSTCKITAEFENPTIDEVLNVISGIFDARIERDGQRYILKSNGTYSEQCR